MNPGPVVVDERVRQALLQPDLCHREPEFSQLMTRVREKITRACGGDDLYTAVIFTGSGTAALEAALTSVVPPDGKILIIDNGYYGERLLKIVSIHGIPHEHLQFEWAEQIDLKVLDRVLAKDGAISHVCMVHHETSTGMLNPVHDAGKVVSARMRSLIVDAVSSLGGEDLNVKRDQIDICIATGNKCLEGFPGISFVCLRRALAETLKSVPPRTFYLDLYSQYVAEEIDRSPAFTPAVQTLYALDEAIDIMLEEGIERRSARYRLLAGRLRAGLMDLGLRIMVPENQRSNTLTAVHLPDGVNYENLHDELKAAGFIIYPAQATLKGKLFRLANMGRITEQDIDEFLRALQESVIRLAAKAP